MGAAADGRPEAPPARRGRPARRTRPRRRVLLLAGLVLVAVPVGRFAARVRASRVSSVMVLRMRDGHTSWRADTFAPVAFGDVLVQPARDGVAVLRRLDDGSVTARLQLRGPVPGASPFRSDGLSLFDAQGGDVAAIDAAGHVVLLGAGGIVRWRAPETRYAPLLAATSTGLLTDDALYTVTLAESDRGCGVLERRDRGSGRLRWTTELAPDFAVRVRAGTAFGPSPPPTIFVPAPDAVPSGANTPPSAPVTLPSPVTLPAVGTVPSPPSTVVTDVGAAPRPPGVLPPGVLPPGVVPPEAVPHTLPPAPSILGPHGDPGCPGVTGVTQQGGLVVLHLYTAMLTYDAATGRPSGTGVAASTAEPVLAGETAVWLDAERPEQEARTLTGSDVRTGEVQWRVATTFRNTWRLAAAGGVVLASGQEGTRAYHPRRGTVVWQRPRATARMVAAGDTAVVVEGSTVVALDAATGRVRWQRRLDTSGRSLMLQLPRAQTSSLLVRLEPLHGD